MNLGNITNRYHARDSAAEKSHTPSLATTGLRQHYRYGGHQHKRQRRRQQEHIQTFSLPSVFVGLAWIGFSYGGWWLYNFWYGPLDTTYVSSLQSQQDVTVFYHIYIPPNKGKKGFQLAQKIVQEQISQVAQAAEAVGKKWNVFFTTTGESNQPFVTHSWLERQACRPYSQHLYCATNGPHMNVGYEDITLSSLHEHCRQSPALEQSDGSSDTSLVDKRIVIYLHSKGTYHSDHGRNGIWRQALTFAATHYSCLESLNQSSPQHGSSKCNVCGLQFYPLWDTMFVGNMFAAQCFYVKQLLEPSREFAQNTERVVQHVNDTSQSGIWTKNLYNFNHPGNTGLQRYTSEHWIASHPTIRPCDMMENNSTIFGARITNQEQLQDTYKNKSSTDPNAWQQYLDPATALARPAPRVAIDHGDWYRLDLKKLESLLTWDDTKYRRRDGATQPPYEYFLLPGLLYRHYFNYHAYPPQDSWIWKWFPDGQAWYDKIYGGKEADGSGSDDANNKIAW